MPRQLQKEAYFFIWDQDGGKGVLGVRTGEKLAPVMGGIKVR